MDIACCSDPVLDTVSNYVQVKMCVHVCMRARACVCVVCVCVCVCVCVSVGGCSCMHISLCMSMQEFGLGSQ